MGTIMNYLLDTHIALWWWADDKHLSKRIRSIMLDENNNIFFSSISGYEITLKNRIGKLPLPSRFLTDLSGIVYEENWKPLTISLREATLAANYECQHRDPFDRILAAQSQLNDYTLLSNDGVFKLFPLVKTIS